MIAPKPALARLPRIAAEQRVRRARRQAQVPRDEVPYDRADEPGKDHPKRDDIEVHHAGADRFRHGGAEAESGDEIEKSGPHHRLPGDSTRVDTTVAMEFAASWNPLM